MQLGEATRVLYEKEAPELLDSVEAAEESPWIMRKDTTTGFCVKFDNGLCGIHKTYGDKFLGDACHFYPRATRALGSQVLMTASLSCPEIARLALLQDNACATTDHEESRLPSVVKNYCPEGMSETDALAIHQAFVDAAGDTSLSPETLFLRIASAARSLERIDQKNWPAMAAFYVKNAASRIPAAEHNIADPFNLLHALCGLMVATRKKPSQRLRQVIDAMEAALKVKLDWEKVLIDADDTSVKSYEKLLRHWRLEKEAIVAPMLRRWLQMQMSLALFPFSGLGSTLSQRVTIIGVRLAIIKLAIMCNSSMHKEEPLPTVVVRVIQSLSRFLDHLGDPAFSISIFTETGWVQENRMRGLLEPQ